MSFARRDFLKVAGLSALAGMGGAAAWELVGPGKALAEVEMPNPKAAVATHWAMTVDLRKIKSQADTEPLIKACVKAHNIPHIPTNQNIKWIWTTDFKHAFTHQENKHLDEDLKKSPVPVLCNHCENPPCVRVCPTQATFKREQDGIVLMDYHRCIGCRFCMAGCPFGARSFNFGEPRDYLKKVTNPRFPTRTKGVVEKCNFCAERLAEGIIPACVEAARDGQLLFGDLDDARSSVRQVLRKRYSIRRKSDLGTGPSVYYLV